MRFERAMASRTDAELIEVVTGDPEDWEADALEAAKAEIDRRGLRFEPRVATPATDAREGEAEGAASALRPEVKLVALIIGALTTVLGVMILLAAMAGKKTKAERRKAAEFAKWAAAGAAFSFVLMLAGVRC